MTFWEEGSRVFFRVEIPAGPGYIYKIWLVGGRGNEMLLGTAAPENGGHRLFRTMAHTQLEYAGCWPVQGVRAKKIPMGQNTQPEWYCEANPERLVPLLKEREESVGAMLCRRGEDGVQLAAAFGKTKPVPLDFLFCFAQARQIQGQWHLVWRFDREGRPRFPVQRTEKENVTIGKKKESIIQG